MPVYQIFFKILSLIVSGCEQMYPFTHIKIFTLKRFLSLKIENVLKHKIPSKRIKWKDIFCS